MQEGYGAPATGGEGGTVYTVSTFAEFKARVEQSGTRIVQGSGTLQIEDDVTATDPNLTIRPVPGTWWQIRSHPDWNDIMLRISTSNVILYKLGLRSGNGSIEPASIRQDCLSLNGASTVMIDHCSFLWGVDENLEFWNNSQDITVQWSIIAEGLYDPYGTGFHGLGHLVGNGCSNVSIHHNLYAHSHGRNPRIADSTPSEIICNVIYNPTDHPMTTNGIIGVDLVKNYYIKGADSIRNYLMEFDPSATIFHTGNACENCTGFQTISTGAASAGARQASPSVPVTEEATVAEVLANVLACVGTGDITDQRIIRDAIRDTGAKIDLPADVGGWQDITNTLGMKIISLGNNTTTGTPFAIVEFYEGETLVHTDSYDFEHLGADKWAEFRAMVDRHVASNGALFTGSETDKADYDISTDANDILGYLADEGMNAMITERLLQVS